MANGIGLYLPVQAAGIANGNVSVVIKTKRIAVKDKTFVLCDDNTAYGMISFTSAPQKLNLPAFKHMVGKHGITDEVRKQSMSKRRMFYAYGFTYKPFSNPKRVLGDIVNDTFIPDVTTIPALSEEPAISTAPSHPPGRKVLDNDPISAKHELEIDFKLQAQEEDGNTKYHLLLKMPTQFIDFAFDHLPTRQFEAIKTAAKTIRWTTAGDISSRHELNNNRRIQNRISIVDTGTAMLSLDGDNQKIVAKLNGGQYKCNMIATRQSKTDTWNMEMI